MVSVCVQELAADVAAGNCFRGHFSRPIMAAGNFASFSFFRPFFLCFGRFFQGFLSSLHSIIKNLDRHIY
jgi:hypothetical protein